MTYLEVGCWQGTEVAYQEVAPKFRVHPVEEAPCFEEVVRVAVRYQCSVVVVVVEVVVVVVVLVVVVAVVSDYSSSVAP